MFKNVRKIRSKWELNGVGKLLTYDLGNVIKHDKCEVGTLIVLKTINLPIIDGSNDRMFRNWLQYPCKKAIMEIEPRCIRARNDQGQIIGVFHIRHPTGGSFKKSPKFSTVRQIGVFIKKRVDSNNGFVCFIMLNRGIRIEYSNEISMGLKADFETSNPISFGQSRKITKIKIG
ncbi:hypothetical protein V6Z11_D04G035900 [Gossypium hirsutum]